MENLRPSNKENIVKFPVEAQIEGSLDTDNKETKHPLHHGLTPVKEMKVEYWHQEAAQPELRKVDTKGKKHYAKRSDEFGLLLLGFALFILILVSVTLYMNNSKYLFSTSKVEEGSTAAVDFYQGNHTFFEKVAAEKAAKKQQVYQVHGLTTVNDDLEVPLQDQMKSMSEKMEKIRSLRQTGEAPPPSPDTGPKTDVSTLKPTTDANFQLSYEFNNALPKDLRTNQ